MIKIIGKISMLALCVSSCAPVKEQESEESRATMKSDKELIGNALAHYNKLTSDDKFIALVTGGSREGTFGLSDAGGKENQVASNLGNRLRKLRQGVSNEINKNLCKYVAPSIGTGGNQLTRPYVAFGYFVNGSALGVQGLIGHDYVWDLYNMQFAAFLNKGMGVALGANTIAATGAALYVAGAFGKKDDVTAGWSGYFNNIGADVSIPNFLKGYFGITGWVFSGAKTKGIPGQNEGDWSMVGAAAGLTTGFTATSEVPINVDIMNSEATLEPALIDIAFQNFKNAGIPVSRSGSATCEGKCVRFDAGVPKGASYSLRGAQLARSFLISTPFMRPAARKGNVMAQDAVMQQLQVFSTLAIATGLFRDSANLAQSCKK